MTRTIIGLAVAALWMLSHLRYLRGERPEGWEFEPLSKILLLGLFSGLLWGAVVAVLINLIMWIFHL
jgi:hypothetical protein